MTVLSTNRFSVTMVSLSVQNPPAAGVGQAMPGVWVSAETSRAKLQSSLFKWAWRDKNNPQQTSCSIQSPQIGAGFQDNWIVFWQNASKFKKNKLLANHWPANENKPKFPLPPLAPKRYVGCSSAGAICRFKQRSAIWSMHHCIDSALDRQARITPSIFKTESNGLRLPKVSSVKKAKFWVELAWQTVGPLFQVNRKLPH